MMEAWPPSRAEVNDWIFTFQGWCLKNRPGEIPVEFHLPIEPWRLRPAGQRRPTPQERLERYQLEARVRGMSAAQRLQVFEDFAQVVGDYERKVAFVMGAYEQGYKIGLGGASRIHVPHARRADGTMAWLAGWAFGNFLYCARHPKEFKLPAGVIARRPWDFHEAELRQVLS